MMALLKSILLKFLRLLLLAVFVSIGGFLIVSLYNVLPEKSLPEDEMVDRIVVEKDKRKMHVYSQNRLLKTYTISLGFSPKGDKQFEGDGKTPEGIYSINGKNPRSSFYLNLGISYPDDTDRREAGKRGLSPGGDIKIHGLPNGLGFIGKLHRVIDWTAGCIAVTNTEIQELYDAVPIGTKIEIKQ